MKVEEKNRMEMSGIYFYAMAIEWDSTLYTQYTLADGIIVIVLAYIHMLRDIECGVSNGFYAFFRCFHGILMQTHMDAEADQTDRRVKRARRLIGLMNRTNGESERAHQSRKLQFSNNPSLSVN